jgi:S1-C subfamily serine protease
MQYWPTGGAMVAVVIPGSPAASAGLQPGDVITAIDGQPVSAPSDVAQTVDVRRPGERLSLQIQRGPLAYTTSATLVARPAGTASP